MVNRHSVDLPDDVEEKWLKYKKEYDANFSKMATKVIREYLEKKLEKKQHV